IARSTFCLQAARALIGERRPIDLSGLEAEIGRLCAGALALPAEEARTLLPSLSALCEEIDEAANALSRARSGPG
ncbi:MAG TPA: hypothetical protein VMA86_12480, partial [Acetobacteraceae bacterium]|nr:hypothetical protein [Acetobacteraceae bacterium]